MHIVNPDEQMLSITEDNMLPRGFPQGVPLLSNSHGCQTRQTPDQFKILNNAKSISKSTLDQITAEMERRKVLDYEIEWEDGEWEQQENDKAITEEDELLAAIDWNSDSED